MPAFSWTVLQLITRVRDVRAGVVRVAVDAPVRDGVGAGDAPDDRPDVRPGDLVRDVDDGARREGDAPMRWLDRIPWLRNLSAPVQPSAAVAK